MKPSRGHVPIDFPCKKEKSLSLKCLEENGSDKDKCSLAFLNFRTCMSFWKEISSQRRRHAIKPELPPPHEREEILRAFRSTGKIPDFAVQDSGGK